MYKDISEFIENNPISIIYFSGSTCGACDAIKEKILKIIKEYNEVKLLEINGVIEKELSATYDVFTLPILILFINGKETIRFGRYFDILEFKKLINRYYELIYN